MGNFFIRRPDRGDGDLHRHGDHRRRGPHAPARSRSIPEITPPLIQVTTTYVGASALDVEQSVATPIEQQVNGVERSIYLKSTNANDGTLKLEVSFEVGADLDISNVLVQNRVSQATPALPADVKNYGVTVKKSLTFPLLLVTLTSPSGAYDSNFLSNYALININDQLTRISGVGQVIAVRRIRLRHADLGPAGSAQGAGAHRDGPRQRGEGSRTSCSRLARSAAHPRPRAPSSPTSSAPRGASSPPRSSAHIIVRANPDGSVVRLKDVARIELGSVLYNARGRLNGKSAAAIAIYQIPGSNALAGRSRRSRRPWTSSPPASRRGSSRR